MATKNLVAANENVAAAPVFQFLDIPASGDWRRDNQAGRRHALELLDHIAKNDATPALGIVAAEMIKRGRHGGVEVGFWQQIAETAIRGLR